MTSLVELVEKLAAPFDVDKAREACARAAAGPDLAELEAMLGIDPVGVVEGVARGLWTASA